MANRRTLPEDDKRIAERRKKALALRLGGATLTDIAETLGVSIGTVHNDIRKCLSDIPRAEADELRSQEVARLDKLQGACWPLALGGDLAAIDRAVKIIDRRAKMLGLDAPQQVEVTGADVDLDATVERLLLVARAVTEGSNGEDVDG